MTKFKYLCFGKWKNYCISVHRYISKIHLHLSFILRKKISSRNSEQVQTKQVHKKASSNKEPESLGLVERAWNPWKRETWGFAKRKVNVLDETKFQKLRDTGAS